MQVPNVPDAGGPTRSYYFLKTLAQDCDLTLVCLSGGKRVGAELRALCENTIEAAIGARNGTEKKEPARFVRWLAIVKVLFLPWLNHWHDFLLYFVQYALPQHQDSHRGTGKRWLTAVLKLWYRLAGRWSQMPPMTAFMYEPSFQAALPQIVAACKNRSFDIIWCEHSTMYPYIERLQNIVKAPVVICNSHNVETLLQERYEQMAAPGWPKEYQRLQTRIYRKLESACYVTSKLVFTCSDDDSESARQLAPNGNYRVVGNGVDTEYFQPSKSAPTSDIPTLVYTGGFGYGPNQDAIRFFVSDVLPRIWAVRPDCEFLFAGFEAKNMWEKLGQSDRRIKYVCSPDDIRPCFDQAWVFVVPLRVGGGTRLKVLEAMSMEKAIVSTTLGAEGIPCESGKHLVYADEPADFAQQVIQLLENPEDRKRLGRAAREWVCEQYDWKILCDRIRADLQALLN
jgi:glycosyltransferase involved in cell wall biosynthesis